MMAHSKKGGDDMEKLTIGIDIGGTGCAVLQADGTETFRIALHSRLFDQTRRNADRNVRKMLNKRIVTDKDKNGI